MTDVQKTLFDFTEELVRGVVQLAILVALLPAVILMVVLLGAALVGCVTP